MNYDKMSREELVSLLVSGLAARSSEAAAADDAKRLLHDLQVHQLELEAQNRELVEARSELEESRNRYADLYDFAPVAYFSLDKGGIVRDLNLSAAKLLGHERERAIGFPLIRFLRFTHPAHLWQHLGRCAASQKPETVELGFQIGDHDYYAEVISIATSGPGSGFRETTFRTAFVDVTRRRRAEIELQRVCTNEQNLRAQIEAVDHANVAVSAVLARGDMEGLQNVVAAILGEAMVLMEAHYAELQLVDGVDFGPDTARRFSAGQTTTLPCMTQSSALSFAGQDLAVLAVHRTYRAQAFRDDGKGKLAMYAERISSALEVARLELLNRRERQRLSLLASITRELENRHLPSQLEDGLRMVAHQLVPSLFRACTFHVRLGQSLKIVAGHHQDADRAANLEQGLRAEGLSGVLGRFGELAEPQVLTGLDDEHREQPLLSADERSGLLELFDAPALVVAPLRSRGRVLGLACFASSIHQTPSATDTPQPSFGGQLADVLECARSVAERCVVALDVSFLLEELREAVIWRENVMATISHDLRSPLNTISLTANGMVEDAAIPARTEKRARLVQRAVDHMNSMIGDLISMSGLEAGAFKVELQEMPAEELVQEACEASEALMKSRSINLECCFSDHLPHVLADKERILRVFSNLLSNAAKFTPPGGRIQLTANAEANRVLFAVSDTGPGIPEDKRSVIFERFWRGREPREKGLGLGLYIARSIVEAHGGKIWVENEVTPGAKLCFDIPRATHRS